MNGEENNNPVQDYSSAIDSAKEVASNFIDEVKGIETELEHKIASLETLVSHLQIERARLQIEVTELKGELAKKSDCEEDDFSADPASSEELAGEKTQQISSRGGGGGKIQ